MANKTIIVLFTCILLSTFILLAVFLTRTSTTRCTISLRDDLSDPQPLLLIDDQFAEPTNDQGKIILYQEDSIVLSCPGGYIELYGDSIERGKRQNVRAACLSEKVYHSGGQFVEGLDKFTCSRNVISKAKYSGKECLEDYKEIEIGFETVTNDFLRLFHVCFDEDQQNTLYSVYILINTISEAQKPNSRPYFDDAGLYNLTNINKLYNKDEQRININRQLGLDGSSTKYIKDPNFYLNKGHLTPGSGFLYKAHMDATFYYVNVAPQWQSFNGGNWNQVEIMVRNFASGRKKDLQVFTGTHGVAELPHEGTGKATQLYLFKEDDEVALPVPAVFWKVVYDYWNQAAIAFVGINNPYIESENDYQYCGKDICDDLKSWTLTSGRKNFSMGYIYCCDVNELRKVVKNIPLTIIADKLLD